MLEIATPDLYRSNAFRVLGLPVNVSSGDLAKQQTRMKMLGKLGAEASQAQPRQRRDRSGQLGKLGADASQAQPAILPLDPPPDAEARRKAAHRLHDPESRMVDELFWFWPVDHQDPEGDSGLRSMRQGDLGSAHRLWCQLEQDGKHRSAAAHNLAVLHHALALDMEHALEDGTHPDPKSVAHRDSHWQVALRHWAAVADDEAVWDRVAARIREVDDPRLTTGVARRVRRTLPIAVLTISIRLAVRSAKQGDADAARRHLSYVHDSGLDSSLTAAILDREVAPLVDQIKQICQPISAQSQADPEHADALADQLMSDTTPLMVGICSLLEEHHHLRQSASDTVTQAIRGCAIEYGNKTEDWERCIELLELAQESAVGDSLCAQLREDTHKVDGYLAEKREYGDLKMAVTGDHVYDVTLTSGNAYQESAEKLGLLKVPGDGAGFPATVPGACACCLGKPDGEQSVSCEWEDTRGLTRYKRTLSFAFPVCGGCRQHQAEYSRKRWLLAVLAAGASTGIVYLVAAQMDAAEWLPFVLVGGLLTGVLLLVCSSFIRLGILPDEHACRDAAVEMSSASDNHVTFRFHNPLYADAFAKANHASVKTHSFMKPPRGSYLLRGRAAIFAVCASPFLGAIGHSIVYASLQDEWKRKSPVTRHEYAPTTPQNTRQTPPQPVGPPPQPVVPPPQPVVPLPQLVVPPPIYSYSGLSSRIETGKARAKAFEAEIAKLDSELESFSGRIRGYKQAIEGYERQIRLGESVNRSLYQQAIANHNLVVDLYSITATQRSDKYAEYRREIDSVNDMVRRFNSGER